jgi:hypothetical protein
MAKGTSEAAVATIDTPSYNQAVDDVIAALANIEASVNGPMPESVWLQVVRMEVEKLRKV